MNNNNSAFEAFWGSLPKTSPAKVFCSSFDEDKYPGMWLLSEIAPSVFEALNTCQSLKELKARAYFADWLGWQLAASFMQSGLKVAPELAGDILTQAITVAVGSKGKNIFGIKRRGRGRPSNGKEARHWFEVSMALGKGAGSKNKAYTIVAEEHNLDPETIRRDYQKREVYYSELEEKGELKNQLINVIRGGGD